MNVDHRSPAQWLRILFYIQLASLILALADHILAGDGWITWVTRALTAGSIFCMLRLAQTNARYLKAAGFRALQLIYVLAGAGISWFVMWYAHTYGSMLYENGLVRTVQQFISMLAMAASWVATYQIYHCHGDLVVEPDPALAQKWYRLFPISIVAGVVTSLGSLILTIVQAALGIGVTEITNAMLTVITIPDDIIALVSLVYLHRTIKRLEQQAIM